MESEGWVLIIFIIFVLLIIGGAYWLASWREKKLREEGLK